MKLNRTTENEWNPAPLVAALRVRVGVPGCAGVRAEGDGGRHRGDDGKGPQQRRVQELQERAHLDALQVSHFSQAILSEGRKFLHPPCWQRLPTSQSTLVWWCMHVR